MDKIESAKKILNKYNQHNLTKILDKLDSENQEKLAKEVLKINFDNIYYLYMNRNEKKEKDQKIEPIDFIDKNKMNIKEKMELEAIGEKIILNNEYAVVTMAGGQGTRLGCKGPKGTFKLEIGKSGKYIFEILAETLKRAHEKYKVWIKWYIMTSIENKSETIEFFEKNNYFGYNKKEVKFFNQSVLPLIDMNGNLLIDKDFNIKKASDGNGGIYSSLKNDGIIADMKKNEIKWVYICGVDNIMANMVDSVLLGLTIKHNASTASKSVKKAYPEEKVGVFCKKNGKLAIQEYIDMDEKTINLRDSNGELLYGDSNIVSHLFNIESLEKLANYKLQYHCAIKKNSYIDENLKEVIPEKPNTCKFETFIFDGFQYLDNMIIMRVNREEEFAPVKNATGVDSPDTAKKIYEKFFNV